MGRRQVDYHWHLRQVMANRGMFATTDIAPLLAERGIELSPAQVYRLVVQTPERLNLAVLAALCDALECTPADLVEPVVVATGRSGRKTAEGARGKTTPLYGDRRGPGRPTRARIVPEE